MLAVVDDEQQPLACERGGDRGNQRRVALRCDPEHGCDRGGSIALSLDGQIDAAPGLKVLGAAHQAPAS
jgi:hypothetical protein